MDHKTIDRIVWWIPFKQLRKDIRSVLNDINYIKNVNERTYKMLSKENIIYHSQLEDMDFYFYDSLLSCTAEVVSKEVDLYNLNTINFKEGDVVIDIGANVGIISIYLAKKYPFLKIYSFEPVKQNYENLIKNIKINNIPDGIITAENIAITKDRRNIDIITPLDNTGGSSFSIDRHLNAVNSNINIAVKSMTFDDIFNKYNIDKCKLLKIDCEGAEYEILYNANENNLKKCCNMRGEFHGSESEQKKLYEYCLKYINNIEYQEAIC
ncbi:FkbM family methyltransferase [uncultured Brachyspira sp.]|uniref:FkbM family methyltransferase n=1 Tax=uncultured Brachyspira sp. TaxID=221953 RepID=UPI00261EA392|nr:FkbM family methyltransferase [uncultured Brachyspira sp.]